MVIDTKKLDFVLAKTNRVKSSLRGEFSPTTLAKISKGGNIKPTTVNRLADALGVPVENILEG